MKKQSLRRCVSCRALKPKEQLWRVVRVYPSGEIHVNQGSGRSAYICPQAECLQAAHKKRRLGKSLRASVPDQIYELLWQRLGRQER